MSLMAIPTQGSINMVMTALISREDDVELRPNFDKST